MDEMQRMMLQLQQLQFMLVDLNLFLDTHTMDRMALAQYNTLHKQYMDMMMSFNMKYGPMMNFGHAPGGMDSFMWPMSPWPWQRSANVPPMRG